MLTYKNFNLVKRAEIVELKNEANKIVEKYLLQGECITIEISRRLKTTAGTVSYKESTKKYTIKLAYEYYKTFGIERSIKTLRHEFAHIIDFKKNKKMSHGAYFKKMCAELGGSMSRSLAGSVYSESASAEYIRNTKKYEYTCTGCGQSAKFGKRMSEKRRNSYRHVCAKCRTPLAKWVEKILN